MNESAHFGDGRVRLRDNEAYLWSRYSVSVFFCVCGSDVWDCLRSSACSRGLPCLGIELFLCLALVLVV